MLNIWDEIYIKGEQLNKYPTELLVSWVFKNKLEANSRVLDVGCGYGNNLKFLLTEGFDAYGIDYSQVVVDLVCKDFNDRVSCQSVLDLDLSDQSFDYIVDRQCIQLVGVEQLSVAYAECARVLKKKGKMFSNFLVETGLGKEKIVIEEDKLDLIISKNFYIKEKNYNVLTTENGENKHKTIIYTLQKR